MNLLRPVDQWFMENLLPHESAFIRFARRWTSNGEEAYDLVQEAYLKTLQINQWESIENPRSYLITVIYNIGLQRIRRDRIASFVALDSTDLDNLSDERPCALQTVSARQDLSKLCEAVEALPPMCRRVIKMRKFDDRTPTDISKELGISLSTVETHLSRGMRQLLAWHQKRVDAVPFASET